MSINKYLELISRNEEYMDNNEGFVGSDGNIYDVTKIIDKVMLDLQIIKVGQNDLYEICDMELCGNGILLSVADNQDYSFLKSMNGILQHLGKYVVNKNGMIFTEEEYEPKAIEFFNILIAIFCSL